MTFLTIHVINDTSLALSIFILEKIISIDNGVYIPGGSQAFGKFRTLKECMKACGNTPTCFAGDFNPWLGKCYFHSNTTACAGMRTHKKLIHFKKVPCGKSFN